MASIEILPTKEFRGLRKTFVCRVLQSPLFVFRVLHFSAFRVSAFPDSGSLCSGFHRFLLFMVRVSTFLVPFPDFQLLIF